MFHVGASPTAKYPPGFGSAAKPNQNQADTRDPTIQKRLQCTASRHGEGSPSFTLLLSYLEDKSLNPWFVEADTSFVKQFNVVTCLIYLLFSAI